MPRKSEIRQLSQKIRRKTQNAFIYHNLPFFCGSAGRDVGQTVQLLLAVIARGVDDPVKQLLPWYLHQIRVAPDTDLAGYPANLFCWISGIRLNS